MAETELDRAQVEAFGERILGFMTRFLRAGRGARHVDDRPGRARVSLLMLVAPWANQRRRTGRAGSRPRALPRPPAPLMIVSTTAIDILEGVAPAATGSAWGQLFRDCGVMADMLARVSAACYRALQALPQVEAQVAGSVPVLMDGGLRRGIEVLEALALGADAVLVGRPIAWRLAAGGEADVA